MKYSELVRQIKALGWYKLKSGGSHDAYAHPTIKRTHHNAKARS